MKKLVIEVHVGKRYGVSRLNCDGNGHMKDVIIDGSRYNRISSQAKKTVWRKNMEQLLASVGENMGESEHVYRTRSAVAVLTDKIKEKGGVYTDSAEQLATIIVQEIMGGKADKDGKDNTKQMLVFTEYDISDILDALCETVQTEGDVKAFLRDTKENKIKKETVSRIKKSLPLRKRGVECALFGRMVTADVMESVESALSVNHSYSMGRAEMGMDYFTVVDNYLSDTAETQQSGAAYLDSKNFETHVYYEYASIDLGQYYENLCKGVDMTSEENKDRIKRIMKITIQNLLNDIVFAAPTGGQHAFATYPDPVGVYVTVRENGSNRTADMNCIKEMNEWTKTEEEKFIDAMTAFTATSDFVGSQSYIKKMYAGESAENISAEHLKWKDAVDKIGEMIDEYC